MHHTGIYLNTNGFKICFTSTQRHKLIFIHTLHCLTVFDIVVLPKTFNRICLMDLIQFTVFTSPDIFYHRFSYIFRLSCQWYSTKPKVSVNLLGSQSNFISCRSNIDQRKYQLLKQDESKYAHPQDGYGIWLNSQMTLI